MDAPPGSCEIITPSLYLSILLIIGVPHRMLTMPKNKLK
jgi:hypothetical protein